ncbi:hypothetical protein C8Q76DRAFT_802870 [Earliella scabrosa]|nr:hypothetical protein C8Q76DRAFT_802870 [Earliella scabrosa]
MLLQQLNDDTLIYFFGFLSVKSILDLRQTCLRLAAISRVRSIWQKACIDQVLHDGYPFPHRAFATADAHELERHVIRALRLGTFWLSASRSPPTHVSFQASTGTGVSNVRFLAGHGGRYILTVYKGIWSMISCWDVGSMTSSSSSSPTRPRKVADWCPKNTIFSGFVTNSDPDSEAAVAVAVQHGGGSQSIEILSIFGADDTAPSFRSICNIATTFRPIALEGDLIAFSDDASETVIMNWRENTFALLKGSQRPIDERFQYNRCLQIIFTYHSVLVVRARSVELFPEPTLRSTEGEYTTYRPIGFHTFGWIDGVSVNTQTGPRIGLDGHVRTSGHEPLSILLRAESDDPWTSDVHKLEQFVLHPNPAYRKPSSVAGADPDDAGVVPGDGDNPAPYLFPPVRAEQTSPTVRGFLRCRDIVLGPSGTALWIQPRAARTAHLTGYDVHSSAAQVSDALNPDLSAALPSPSPSFLVDSDGSGDGTREALCAAVFAGPLQRRHPGVGTCAVARTLWVQRRESANWTAFDYEEEAGRVALGLSDGRVEVLDLV